MAHKKWLWVHTSSGVLVNGHISAPVAHDDDRIKTATPVMMMVYQLDWRAFLLLRPTVVLFHAVFRLCGSALSF